ncbi:hypothetical protein ACGF0D_25755 [Kitasatospora sp. NPDC048298]|uniref:hypothetical protein n=1 Tax=Kitasatospora sp. NPDC048298 TaxID=3364049 RepID=UPI003716D30F
MKREPLVAVVLAVLVGSAPAVLVALVAAFAPSRQTAGLLWFVALALAMVGIVFGPGWAEWLRHRRRVLMRRRARHGRAGS